MQIVCSQCNTWYDIPAASAGRLVRCASCRAVFTAVPAEEPAVAAAASGAWAASAPSPEPPSWPTDAGGPSGAAEPSAAADDPETADSTPGPTDDASLADAPDQIADAPPVAPDQIEALDGTPAPARDWDAEFEAAEARRNERIRLGGTKTKPKRRFGAPSWATVVLSLLVVIGAILAWRVDIVRALPQTASLFARIGLPVNLRGLALEQIKIERDMTDKVPALVVQGVIANVTKARVEVPRLRFSLRGEDGNEIYTWTALPQKNWLAPNEEQAFKTRLASPSAEAREVAVRFFSRRDR